jgi:hypothetical protein
MDDELYTGEDVTVPGEQSREDALQKPNCSAIPCARSAGDGNAEE